MIGNIVYAAVMLFFFVITFTNQFSVFTVLIFSVVFVRILLFHHKGIIFWSIFLGILFIYRMTFLKPVEADLTDFDNESLIIDIKETSIKLDGDKMSFEGKFIDKEFKEKVMVTYYIGSEMEKEALLSEPPKRVLTEGVFSRPGEPDNFHQFNYRTYLETRQIKYVLTATKLTRLEDERFRQPNLYTLDSYRQLILNHIDRTMDERPGTYTKTLLFADKRTFSSDTMDSFRDLGIVHLLSISGLHVVLVIDMIENFCRKIRISKETTSTCLLVFLPIYGLTAGFGISVTRAIGQMWLKLVGVKVDRVLTTLDCWSLMVILNVMIQPYSIYTVSFQLSYLISFVIIMVTHQPFYKKLSPIKGYIGLNLILFICAIPVLVFHFYEFSWGVLILNSLFIPFIANLLLPWIVLNFLLSFLISDSTIYEFSTVGLDRLILTMEELVNRVASNVSFTVITGRLSQLAYVILVFCILFFLLLVEKKELKTSLLIPLTGILLCVFSVRYSPFGQVLMIDVDQGEAILIREPWGQGNFLIDTGGQHEFPTDDWKKRDKNFTVGINIMIPVLKSEGIHQLDSIIVTHPDIDHYGALIEIISQIKTNVVVSSKSTYYHPDFQTLFPSIDKYGTIIKEVNEGMSNDLPLKSIAILSNEMNSYSNKNNNSLVILGLLGEKSWLFTGDLEIEGEEELIRKYPNLKVDVLKIGHHGSQTSTHDDFLKEMEPQTALISSGENNRYGHPHDTVIERLTEADTEIYRTDIDGAVRYKFSQNPYLKRLNKYLFSFETKRRPRGE